MYQVLVDGEVGLKPVKITGAKSYQNAEVYLGDPHYPAAEANVKNLHVGDCVHDEGGCIIDWEPGFLRKHKDKIHSSRRSP